MKPSTTQKPSAKQTKPAVKRVATTVRTSVSSSKSSTPKKEPSKDIVKSQTPALQPRKPFPQVIQNSSFDYFQHVPNEIVLEIVQYLDIGALGALSSTCRRFCELLNHSVLWEHYYRLEFSTHPSKNLTPLQWKSKLKQDLTSSRRKKIANRFKNSSTSMKSTESVMKTLRMEWKVQINDQAIPIPKKRVYVFPFSLALFCTDLPDFALSSNIAKKDKIRLQAKHMKSFASVGYSPYLALTTTILKSNHVIFSASNWTEIYRDDLISLNEVIIGDSNHVLIGLWLGQDPTVEFVPSFSSVSNDNSTAPPKTDDRSGKEVAFLIHSLLHGDVMQAVNEDKTVVASKAVRQPTRRHVPVLDDIDTAYGLHGYTAAIHIRTAGTSKFYHMFDKVLFRPCEGKKGSVVAVLIKSEGPPGHRLEGELSLPWKAGAFTKSIPKMAIMDFILLDERKEVIWAFTRAVSLQPTSVPIIYDHPEDSQYFSIQARDKSRGTVEGVVLYSQGYNSTMVVSIQAILNTDFVNKWFGTRYTF